MFLEAVTVSSSSLPVCLPLPLLELERAQVSSVQVRCIQRSGSIPVRWITVGDAE